MEDSMNRGCFLFLNPWILHLQKMRLELKCLLCLNLLDRPLLLPCDHIFCSSCVPRSTGFGSVCPACKSPFVDKDLRLAPFVENMLYLYKSMNAAFGANLFHWIPQSQIDAADMVRASDQFPVTFTTLIEDRLRKEPDNNRQTGTSCNPNLSQTLRDNEGAKVPLQHSEVKIEKSTVPDEFHVPINGGLQKGLMQSLGEQRTLQREGNATSSQAQQLRDELHDTGRAPEGYLSPFTQIPLDSPPSFGVGKDSDDDSSCHGSQHSVEKFFAKNMWNKESLNGIETEMGQGPLTQPGGEHDRGSKRMKLNYEARDFAPEKDIHKSSFIGSESTMTSKSIPTNCSSPTMESSVRLDGSDSKSTMICAFCQTSSLSQYTGPMMHLANGKEVVADNVAQPNVLHVHRRCLIWTPQVYFVGDIVYNLEKEISRGAKLKCSYCGLKGAALGCYVKSCRKSFHVPCAVQIEGCRWDIENFHVLCPTHSSKKFSNEISKLRKRMGACHVSENQVDNGQDIKFGETLVGNHQGWVLCGSSLSIIEENLLDKLAELIGATISKVWKPNVTHVIAATDDMGACSRTVKVLMAILHGKWVLKIDWLKACLEARCPLSEEPYEVQRDIHGCCDGPKNGRLRVLEKAPRLFTGLNFYFFGDFAHKEYLQDLVLAAGGGLLTNKDMLLPEDGKHGTSSTFVVYSRDLPQSGTSVRYMDHRFKEANDFAAGFGCQVTGHTWILESIAACKIQALRF